MKILVISNSIVINKLLSLTFDKNDIDSEIVSDIDDATSKDYSLIFIDDILSNLGNIIATIKKDFDFFKLIIISNKEDLKAVGDLLLNKPFQGQDVQELLDSINLNEELIFDDEEDELEDIDEDEELDIELNSLIKRRNEDKTNILDPNEIERIKALMALEADEEEILGDTTSFVDKMRAKESLKLKSKHSKQLLKELAILNKKELKKLLKGAKIRIKVEYE